MKMYGIHSRDGLIDFNRFHGYGNNFYNWTNPYNRFINMSYDTKIKLKKYL